MTTCPAISFRSYGPTCSAEAKPGACAGSSNTTAPMYFRSLLWQACSDEPMPSPDKAMPIPWASLGRIDAPVMMRRPCCTYGTMAKRWSMMHSSNWQGSTQDPANGKRRSRSGSRSRHAGWRGPWNAWLSIANTDNVISALPCTGQSACWHSTMRWVRANNDACGCSLDAKMLASTANRRTPAPRQCPDPVAA